MSYMLMPLRRYADFSGRSRRKEYWMWALFNLLVAAVLIVPLTIVTLNALRQVEAQGGVRYRSDFGSPTERYDIDRPSQETPGDTSRSGSDGAKPQADDWSANPGPDSDSDRAGNGSDGDNGAVDATDTSDKVSSRVPATTPGGGILAFSYGGGRGYGVQLDIDPFMFFRAFGPLGWALFSIYCLWGLITFIPNLAVAIRRLHDTDRSGWWLLISMVPLVGAIVLLVFLLTEGTRGPNRFGADPKGPGVDGTFA